jgi:hypothetical protein
VEPQASLSHPHDVPDDPVKQQSATGGRLRDPAA